MIIQCYADDYFNACIEGPVKIEDKSMLELGNEIVKNCLGVKGKMSAKDLWKQRGIKEHISVDINGKNGALPIDLRKDVMIEHPDWKEHFDICTNIGTLEHLDGDIYQGYKNFHEFCKVGGIMIHAGPPIGSCPKHSPNHYRLDFFSTLFMAMGYEEKIVQMRIPQDGRNENLQDNLILFAIAKRTNGGSFMDKESFMEIFKG